MAAIAPALEARVRAAAGRRWLLTGSAGFIGSHLLETLLSLGQDVVSLDNFATGHRANLEDVRRRVGADAWRRHTFIEGSIVDPEVCHRACGGADLVLHQAALGSVPRSINDPLATHAANATGFLNILWAARQAGVKRVVYAASSSTYGDSRALPKVEDVIGRPLSPYAVTKYLNELYGEVFARCYGSESIGLRYFNVFGPRQDPNGAYAAVIPRWIAATLRGEECIVNGDGETSRDFCFVANAVQANLLAALSTDAGAVNQVYNVAVGGRTSLLSLHRLIADEVERTAPGVKPLPVRFGAFRDGDVRHSQADISRAATLLGYVPSHDVERGIRETVAWYVAQRS